MLAQSSYQLLTGSSRTFFLLRVLSLTGFSIFSLFSLSLSVYVYFPVLFFFFIAFLECSSVKVSESHCRKKR